MNSTRILALMKKPRHVRNLWLMTLNACVTEGLLGNLTFLFGTELYYYDREVCDDLYNFLFTYFDPRPKVFDIGPLVKILEDELGLRPADRLPGEEPPTSIH